MSTPLILVFDDDLVNHQDFLAPLPARFVYRADADRAVTDVKEVGPDCVFMDFSMNARLSGAQAIELLREHWGYRELPIVGISSDTRLNRKLRIAGATVDVAKMALPQRFHDVIKVVLGGS